MKRIISMVMVCLVFLGILQPVQAAEWGTTVNVTQEDQIIDQITYNEKTVYAYYTPYGEQSEWIVHENGFMFPERNCTEFVYRFYETVLDDPYFFENYRKVETTTPQVGDWAETYDGAHVAIVKAVNGNKYTLIEQNLYYQSRTSNIAVKDRVTTGTTEFRYYHLQKEMDDEKVTAFVTRLYQLCLNRNPDSVGLADWVNQLKTGKKTAAQVVYGFFFSKEMVGLNLSNEDYIERCYNVMMDRGSDSSGKSYWLERLTNGVTRLYVVRGFVESKEFTNICNNYGVSRGSLKLTDPRDQNYGITSFVARCYIKALERNYDEGGLTNWVNKIINAANRKQAAIDTASNSFFHSKEFLNKNLSNVDYVKVLYRTFLGREYDQRGLDDWVGQLNRGVSRDKVMNGFAYSQEFAKIMAQYGIQ